MTCTNNATFTIRSTASSFPTTSSISSFDIFWMTSTSEATFGIRAHRDVRAIVLFCTAFIYVITRDPITSGTLFTLTSIAPDSIGARRQLKIGFCICWIIKMKSTMQLTLWHVCVPVEHSSMSMHWDPLDLWPSGQGKHLWDPTRFWQPSLPQGYFKHSFISEQANPSP